MNLQGLDIKRIYVNYPEQSISINDGQITLRPITENREKIMLMSYFTAHTSKYPPIKKEVKGFTWKWAKANIQGTLGKWGISTGDSFRQLWYQCLNPDTWNIRGIDTDKNALSPDHKKQFLETLFVSSKAEKHTFPGIDRNTHRMHLNDSATIELFPGGNNLLDALKILPVNINKNALYISKEMLEGVPDKIEKLIIPFEPFMEDWKKDFEGRDYVFRVIYDFLNDINLSWGYLLIRGLPGIGKSAVISEFIARAKLPIYHFNIATSRMNSSRRFFENICARLIKYFKLPYEELPQNINEDGVFFNKVLNEAALMLDVGKKLVIAIDALDEVEPEGATGLNPLYLPISLPKRVYFVITARDKHELGLLSSNLKEWKFKHDTQENLTDISNYIAKKMHKNHIIRWMKKKKINKQEFVDLLCEKSEGNFMYIRHILPAIEKGDFDDRKKENLPYGLKQYYRCHWTKMRNIDVDTFEKLCRPVICCLSIAEEPISVRQIAQWTKLEPYGVKNVLKDWWEFLHVLPGPKGEILYRIYHKSFQDFLMKEADVNLYDYHKMIIESIENRINKQNKG